MCDLNGTVTSVVTCSSYQRAMLPVVGYLHAEYCRYLRIQECILEELKMRQWPFLVELMCSMKELCAGPKV